MKLVLYINGEWPHNKNHQALIRMCRSLNIEYEETHDYNRLKTNNYDILISCHSFINPDDIPLPIKIIMGPQFFTFPSGIIVGSLNTKFAERCIYNTLSPWIKTLYLEFANDLVVPMVPLPFGVDINKFRPECSSNDKKYDCIVYIKRRSNAIVKYTIDQLNNKGLQYIVFKYGSYNETEYLDALRSSKFMITLDAHESQGFALEEAMSSGVPLLVMDAISMYDEMDDGVHSTYQYLRPKNLYATSVPYWSDECGIRITDQNELAGAIDRMLTGYKTYTPRDYIVRTLSDEVCMRRILDYFRL
jgi:glycosyltransferase involved in cell wall biosynthesis